ncbi:4-amino-4-deoxy-L-arabinose transferase-like glycosyltransferase [Catenuloplanes nepalensis]|uniref:4-amino-4-deoxy-L-arabinose transferase-like glycosyltransferase n=1 Tax=Catenuloplanes nepalensis TaxID=587533 RepID=A0ABT9N5Q6_9ACTN|nr:glycosyltransferase family 39 protein [Catenuloplanes nepalensis]MDP9799047.1 4-amino-4-deoxy-L-arabinose transferase-like glycosyltransferase [Catenuloplanes nepalensis]
MTSTLPAEAVPSPETPDPPPETPATVTRSRRQRILRGPDDDPAWARPALYALLIATAVLYLWGLSASGWANSFYAAAVQAGSESWKAFFFGSSDAANFITVDKTPLSLWPMSLAARIFGMNSWSMLVPQALMGVASVALLYATVRRWFPPAAALLAGAVLATTPVAALMFRFNNPDALLVLLMIAACWAMVRALERGATTWLLLCGVLMGLGYLAKMLQVLLILPALGLVYLIAGPPKLGRRFLQLLGAAGAMIVAAGWWILAVELWPEDSRPYIGGSQNNSILELTLGYNGLGRLNGNETGSVGGGGTGGPGGGMAGPGGGGGNGGGMWGESGILRMFDSAQGGQIAWLLPAALVLMIAGLVVTARRPRTDRTRAAFVIWGGWLVVTTLTFSFMQGIFHAYYTVALAPAIGALTGMGGALLWSRRRSPWAIALLAATVAGTAVWAWVLLGRSADWYPWLRWTVLIGGVVAAVALAATSRLAARIAVPVGVVAAAITLAAPAAYAINTAGTPHGGAIPSAGPMTAGGFGGGPGGGRGGRRTFPGGQAIPGGGQMIPGGGQAMPGGGFPGGGQAPPQGFTGGGQGGPGAYGRGNAGGMGGLLNGSEPSAEMVALLEKDADRYTWIAAAVGSNRASGYQLATGDPVMAIGGFNGTDPTPSLAQFQEYVEQGKIHYFIGDGGFGGGGRDGSGQVGAEIATWVQANFASQTLDDTTIYDLTVPASASQGS